MLYPIKNKQVTGVSSGTLLHFEKEEDFLENKGSETVDQYQVKIRNRFSVREQIPLSLSGCFISLNTIKKNSS
ncbi:hypothetical protein EYV94_10805 [Puteibacter caeruleilacunae]|nr:hypothetical protein EYV94_10805 [Puteibacter caeruleilacunae]